MPFRVEVVVILASLWSPSMGSSATASKLFPSNNCVELTIGSFVAEVEQKVCLGVSLDSSSQSKAMFNMF